MASSEPLERIGSLVAVGAGITGVGQTTLEAQACIETADVVLYCVVEPTTELWLRRLNANCESLSSAYKEDKPRADTYDEMTKRLVGAVKSGLKVCAVFYGHPGVLVESTHSAIATLRAEGFDARMLPGVSADACLFADLGINPGEAGLQSYEATDFLLYSRSIDSSCGLLLWQVGVLGDLNGTQGAPCNQERLTVLAERLKRDYPETHEVLVYYAPTFPASSHSVERLSLSKLATTEIWPLALLFVPPLPKRAPDLAVARWFVPTA